MVWGFCDSSNLLLLLLFVIRVAWMRVNIPNASLISSMGLFRTLTIHVFLIQHQNPPGIFGANTDTKEPHNGRFLWREGIHKHLHHFASQWESNITLFGCLQGIHNKLLAFPVEFPTKTEEATHTRKKQRQRKKCSIIKKSVRARFWRKHCER